MTFIEFVGFLITMFALVFIFLRKTYEEKYRRAHPEEYEQEERERQETVRRVFKELDIDLEALGMDRQGMDRMGMEPEEEPVVVNQPSPPIPKAPIKRSRSVKHDYNFESNLDTYEDHFVLEDYTMQTEIKDGDFDSLGVGIVSEDLMLSPEQQALYRARIQRANSRGKNFLETLPSRNALFLSHEIFNQPKGLTSSVDAFHYF